MKVNKIIHGLLLVMTLWLTACRDEADNLLQPGVVYGETLTSQFDQIWKGINQNYVFWEIDSTDMDAVYANYRPLIEKLDEQEVVETEELQKLYEEAFGNLIDHHLMIKALNVKAAPGDQQIFYVYPSHLAHEKREGFHGAIPATLFGYVRQKMIGDRRISFSHQYIDENSSIKHLETCVIDNDILYLSFRSFKIIEKIQDYLSSDNSDYWYVYDGWYVYDVYSEYIRQLLFNENLKGIIVDVRSNGGGDVADMLTVLSPLIKEDIHPFDTKTKMGVGRLDYSEWTPWHCKAATQRQMGELLGWKEQLPDSDCIGNRNLVFLIDCQSGSMAEITTLGAKGLPYATVIGERSYGALGPLISDVHNSFCGQFGDTNLKATSYFVYTSTWMTRTPEGEYLEGTGIEPDITVPLDITMIVSQDIDNQLEYAINYLHSLNEY